MDVNKMADAVFASVKGYVAKSLQPLADRIKALEDVDRVKAQMSDWALDFERRAQGVLERAVDRLPKPENGKDGIGFDDLTVEHDGERLFTVKFTKGDEVKAFPFTLPAVIDRGVHKSNSEYVRGDAVTFGGSLWIAQKDAPEDKPGHGDGWRLAVKKGRDGRDGK